MAGRLTLPRPRDKTCRRDLSTSSSRVAQVESLGICDKGEGTKALVGFESAKPLRSLK
jgi:hypothetical protein